MDETKYILQVILVAKIIVMPWMRVSTYAGQPYLATRMDDTPYISQVILVAQVIAISFI